MTAIKLKTQNPFFTDILEGRKDFEVRKEDDKFYKVGDLLYLCEVDENLEFTGRSVMKYVKYKLVGEAWGIKRGYCVLGLKDNQS